MIIRKDYYTKNRCYTNNRNYKKIGIIIHSTATKGIMAEDWKRRWDNPTVAKMVHAFVDNKEAIEVLPDTREAWHVATQKGNRYFYGIELCEDRDHTRAYFMEAYLNDVEFTAKKVKELGVKVTDIYSHKEAHRLGFASNHGDPDHWWGKFGYNMDMFRRDVQAVLGGKEIASGGVSDTPINSGLDIDGLLGPATIRRLQRYFKTIEDGKLSSPSNVIKELQKALGVGVDGYMGIETITELQRQFNMKYVDGRISNPSNVIKELQRRLNNRDLKLKNETKAPEASKPDPKTEAPKVPEVPKLSIDGRLGPSTIAAWQKAWKMKTVDGVISPISDLIKELQKRLNNNKM